jgi:hypothetical protein
MKADTIVYRVVEDDLQPDKPGLHTWKVASVIVERASDRQIKLKTRLPGHGGTLFNPNALGRHFFTTPLQAIQFFKAERHLEIEKIDRLRKEAVRAIAWAELNVASEVEECLGRGDNPGAELRELHPPSGT